MADFADDAAALLDAVGWDDCLVLGISFGGMVAQEVAIRHPERVRRLVLACTSAGGAGGASYPLHELADLSPEERSARRMELLDTRWDEAWRKAHPEMVALIAERMPSRGRGSPSQGLTNQLAARAEHDTSERLGAIACPTLVCGGRFDGIAPPANSEFLARAIPGARLEMFDGGHAFFMQDPDRTSRHHRLPLGGHASARRAVDCLPWTSRRHRSGRPWRRTTTRSRRGICASSSRTIPSGRRA